MGKGQQKWILIPPSSVTFEQEVRASATAFANGRGFCQIRFCTREALRAAIGEVQNGREADFGVFCHAEDSQELRTLSGLGVPCVLWGDGEVESWEGAFGGSVSICSVNNREVGELAAKTLLKRGHYRSFLYVDGVTERHRDWWWRTRGATFTAAVEAAGCACGRFTVGTDAVGEELSRLRRVLGGPGRPTAVFACSDRVALEVVSFCHALGVSVPDDVAVLGVNDERGLCEGAHVGLSSVRLDPVALGREAMRMLLARIAGESTSRAFALGPDGVVERASTRRPVASDAYVNRALSFIAAASPSELSVARVVAESGSSRSYLERRFKSVTGCSIHDAIVRRVMEFVKYHVENSELPISRIAECVGFSASGLSSLFRRTYGVSMSGLRATRREARADP